MVPLSASAWTTDPAAGRPPACRIRASVSWCIALTWRGHAGRIAETCAMPGIRVRPTRPVGCPPDPVRDLDRPVDPDALRSFPCAGNSRPTQAIEDSSMTELTLAKAQTIISAALAHAREKSFAPMAVVVLDARGVLKAYAAEDGTALRRADIAIGK